MIELYKKWVISINKLNIRSFVEGTFIHIEDYIINLSKSLPYFGPVVMTIDLLLKDENKEYDDEKAREIGKHLIEEIDDVLEESHSVLIFNPGTFWYHLYYVGMEECGSFNKIIYSLNLRKVR